MVRMTDDLSTDGLGRLLTALCRTVAERIPAEEAVPAAFRERNAAAEKQFNAAQGAIAGRYETDRAAAVAETTAARQAILARFETDYSTAEQEYEEIRRAILSRSEEAQGAIERTHREARWEATTVYEATKDGPALHLKEITQQLEARRQEFGTIHQEAAQLLQRRWQWRDYPEPQVHDLPKDVDPTPRFVELIGLARTQLRALANQTAARLFEGPGPLGIFVGIWLLSIYPSGLATGWRNGYWIAVSGVAAGMIAGGLLTWLYRRAKKQSADGYLALRQSLAEADRARYAILEVAKTTCERQRAAINQRLTEELKRADDRHAAGMAELRDRREADLEEVDRKYPALLAEVTSQRDGQLDELELRRARRAAEIEDRFRTDSSRLLEEHTRAIAASDQRYRQEWGALVRRWLDGVEHFRASLGEMNDHCDRLFADFGGPAWSDWQPPAEVPSAIRFGAYDVRLDRIEGGIPKDARLRPSQTEFRLPALLPFPRRSLLMLRTSSAEDRAKAVEAIRSIMLRSLTAMPPAKVRFTIVDPVGLGENFSAFMHLADYDEKLVSSRIWTESAHIEQRLADLTEHMETVIQVYLRNEFQSIQEYNAFAGELAEPYRVLVVANFPAGFSDVAARRLTSIVASGARCGVYTVLSVDGKLRMPRDFHLADLVPHAFELECEEGRFIWDHPDYGRLPLEVDAPPPAERFTEIVRLVGQKVQEADRVEVPFGCAVPEPDQWWAADSRDGIDVPLGRAGAKKLQHLQLGKGTSQHVLVSGKTGSGKSTLWHALITNTAIRYSPDEVQLYLVDFKKGVEFKAYASSELPHARVIAIESEREFGLSVLERLDAELRDRGDQFRNLGVQDLHGFRALRPEARLPRILLIVDEFQELFVEDDRIAQNAALLLDRLVRQGRAFGIHVLLGSQTLAGAYSLPRSTIGQMAVRIALQCSEADAHLILSEDNTAARLLARPGEAIYNDANGLYEGNHPFQVVWLPDDERERYLREVADLARRRKYEGVPAIVFEGNVPADPAENAWLGELLSAPAWPVPSAAPRAWLGAAVAIKDPTAAIFPRQSGANLLLAGHRDDLALGIMATSVVSLAAQNPPGDAKSDVQGAAFYVLDGIRPDAPEAGCWKRLAGALPHAVRVAAPRDAVAVLAELSEELARREELGREDAPPVYLVIYNLARFRELRRADDDFGFSRGDDDRRASPAKQFAAILREGPPLGIHTLLWCDTYNNLNNAIDRQGMRELEMRVLFPMNATDSSNLIDSTAAAQLGTHRAVLYNEGLGHLEKFRPYRFPGDAWLAWVSRQLRGRAGSTVPGAADR
jgi:S-DNA-T family DNA segregation ATPase FtsK/SpoIIIE